METTPELDEIVSRAERVVRESGALFGYVYQVDESGKTFLRGRPLYGTLNNERTLQWYYKAIGDRALQLVAHNHNQAVPMTPGERAESWFAVVITQDLGAPACVVCVYTFYDRDEAVRTLRLVEMIMKFRPRGS